jgi:hypothetical protein
MNWSFRDGPQDQTRNLEIPDRRFASFGMTLVNAGAGIDPIGRLPVDFPSTCALIDPWNRPHLTNMSTC